VSGLRKISANFHRLRHLTPSRPSGYCRPALRPGPGSRRLGMKCSRCQQHNPPHAMFCLQCGAPVRRSAGDDASQASYTELQRSLTKAVARESAIGEILRVIGSSPTDAQPVFDAIARAATTLCEADLSGVYPFDGDLIHFGAQHGRTAEEVEAAQRAFPQPPSRLSVTARAILAHAPIQAADVSEDREVADSLRIYRTVLSVPMMRNERPVGAITVARRVIRAFSEEQIALLKTFADQAVIAIENVRLFTETKEALERQTA